MKLHTILKMLIIIAIAGVAGCAQFQAKVNQDVDKVLALGLSDLDAAHARAVAANDPNPAHDMCWTGLAAGIRAKAAADEANTPAQISGPAGLADGAEAFLLSNNQPISIELPTWAPGVESACFATIGELRVKATVEALRFSAAIAATMQKLNLGAGALSKGAGVAKLLQAAQAAHP